MYDLVRKRSSQRKQESRPLVDFRNESSHVVTWFSPYYFYTTRKPRRLFCYVHCSRWLPDRPLHNSAEMCRLSYL